MWDITVGLWDLQKKKKSPAAIIHPSIFYRRLSCTQGRGEAGLYPSYHTVDKSPLHHRADT